MATIQHTCSDCIPIDASILEVYIQLIGAKDSANTAAERAEHAAEYAIGKSPYIGENGDWFEWNDELGQFVDTMVQAQSSIAVDTEMSATSTNPVQNKAVTEAVNGKQATLVSGENIKTVNGESILGSGNIVAGDPNAVKYVEQTLTDAQKAQARTNIGAGTYTKAGTGIPKTDLASAVQTSLGKADTAYQKPDTGVPASDMASAVQTSLGKADSAYQKPGTGIPSTDMASAVQTSLGKADTAYQKPAGGIPKTDTASDVQASLGKADTAVQYTPVGSITPPVTPSDWATAEELSQLEAEVTDNTDNINNLQAEIDAITPIVIEGNVTNAPDEEDITTDSSDLLKFKDRTPGVKFKGYVILRKNKTFAEQVVATNTIYEIRYGFDLNGATVTIPEGCTLKFNGGSVDNGTIVGQDTLIDAISVKIFGGSLVTLGGFVNSAPITWWGATADLIDDDGHYVADSRVNNTPAIQAALDSAFFKIIVPTGWFYVETGLTLTKGKEIELEGTAYYNRLSSVLTSVCGAIYTDKDIDVLTISCLQYATNSESSNVKISGGLFDVSLCNVAFTKDVIKVTTNGTGASAQKLWGLHINTSIKSYRSPGNGIHCEPSANASAEGYITMIRDSSFISGFNNGFYISQNYENSNAWISDFIHEGVITGCKTAVRIDGSCANSKINGSYQSAALFDSAVNDGALVSVNTRLVSIGGTFWDVRSGVAQYWAILLGDDASGITLTGGNALDCYRNGLVGGNLGALGSAEDAIDPSAVLSNNVSPRLDPQFNTLDAFNLRATDEVKVTYYNYDVDTEDFVDITANCVTSNIGNMFSYHSPATSVLEPNRKGYTKFEMIAPEGETINAKNKIEVELDFSDYNFIFNYFALVIQSLNVSRPESVKIELYTLSGGGYVIESGTTEIYPSNLYSTIQKVVSADNRCEKAVITFNNIQPFNGEYYVWCFNLYGTSKRPLANSVTKSGGVVFGIPILKGGADFGLDGNTLQAHNQSLAYKGLNIITDENLKVVVEKASLKSVLKLAVFDSYINASILFYIHSAVSTYSRKGLVGVLQLSGYLTPGTLNGSHSIGADIKKIYGDMEVSFSLYQKAVVNPDDDTKFGFEIVLLAQITDANLSSITMGSRMIVLGAILDRNIQCKDTLVAFAGNTESQLTDAGYVTTGFAGSRTFTI